MVNKLVHTILLSFLLASIGYSEGKWKIAIVHDGDDILGKQLVHGLQKELTKSSDFLLVPQDEAIMTVRILSLDIGDTAGLTSICSVAFTVQNPNHAGASFCDHTVLRFVKPNVDETATDLLGTILRICDKCVGDALKTPD